MNELDPAGAYGPARFPASAVVKADDTDETPPILIGTTPAAAATGGPWMQTASGRRFWFLNPSPEDVSLQDIAHALAMTCRFGGHSPRFYSVAEHSVLASLAAPPELALGMLLHDATEAYIGDVIRPLKRRLWVDCTDQRWSERTEALSEIEVRILNAVQRRFNLAHTAFYGHKEIDERMLATEARELFGVDARREWGVDAEPYSFALACWTPEAAELHFLARFHALRGQ